jgi:hypothetical protein
MYQFWAIFSQTLLVTLPETIHRIIPKALMHACMHAHVCVSYVADSSSFVMPPPELANHMCACVGQSHVCIRTLHVWTLNWVQHMCMYDPREYVSTTLEQTLHTVYSKKFNMPTKLKI